MRKHSPEELERFFAPFVEAGSTWARYRADEATDEGALGGPLPPAEPAKLMGCARRAWCWGTAPDCAISALARLDVARVEDRRTVLAAQLQPPPPVKPLMSTT